MISEIFSTNLIAILFMLFIDDFFDLKLSKTKLNLPLCLWALLTIISIPSYLIYLIWS